MRVVVASVPASHPYVDHLALLPGAASALDVVRLPDPDPRDPSRPVTDGVWWPPVMLDVGWARAHDFDLMHVHFGIDERTPEQLRDLVSALDQTGRPLVLTLHDLRSPHQRDRRTLDAQLDVLVPAAAAVLTLTEGAAAEIARRWDRRAVVVPHPHLVDLDVMERVRGSRPLLGDPPRVGVSAKSLRPNTDVRRLLAPLLSVPDVRPVVSVHRSWWERPTDLALATELLDAARRDRLELVVHEPWADAELWDFVSSLDVAVLPYTFGTHSGWLEMCHDLGTSVVVPDVGHYASQGVDGVFGSAPGSLSAAVAGALSLRRRGLPGLDADARAAQRAEVVRAHERVYADLLAATRRGASSRRDVA